MQTTLTHANIMLKMLDEFVFIYRQAFLQSNLGKYMRIELAGVRLLIQRTGGHESFPGNF